MKKIHLAFIVFIFLILGCTNSYDAGVNQYVNPFIGTEGTGHTYPGATTPFGLVQLSPDMSIDRWEFCSGYNTQINSIIGFSHTHLNGVGLSDFGDILVMPTIGDLTFRKGSESKPETGYRSVIDFQKEIAEPGYYSVNLEKYNILAEMTASPRVGFHRYSFPKTDSLNLIIDIESNISFHDIRYGKLEVLNDTTLEGHKVVIGKPGLRNVYFVMLLSQPIETLVTKDQWPEKDIIRPISKATKSNTIKLDGQLDEPVWKLDHKIERVMSGNSENKGSFSTAWDNKNLYIGIHVSDNNLVSDSNNPWDDDGIEIYIDGNKSRSETYDSFDRQIAISAGSDNVQETKGNPFQLQKKSLKTTDGYTAEIAIEWQSLGITPEEGLEIGLDISIDDDDDNGGREGQLIWAGDDNNWLSTAYFGTLILTDKNGELENNESVKQVSIDQNDFKIEKFPKVIENKKGIVSAVTFNSKNISELLVKVGLSTTSTEAALRAIQKEVPGWDFDQTRERAALSWLEELSRINIEASEKIKKVFYTSMYHAMLQPNLISDIDGKFTAPDGKIHTGPNSKFYSTFSLWDTYRAWHPLMTIIDTTRVQEMANSILYSFDFYGHLPRWTLWAGESHNMIGNHAIPVLVDAYLKGIKGIDEARIYETIKGTSVTPNPLSNWEVYNKYGYLPYDIERTESVSKTLEMAYNDWCVAKMAHVLEKKDDYNYFSNRAGFYKNVFDTTSNFMRGRDSNGQWIPDFDPMEVAHVNLGFGCYTEGNAWQHCWYVPHDVEGLISLMGGKKQFVAKLDSLFTMDSEVSGDLANDVTGLIGQYAHGNEPSHHVAYLYNYAGEPWKTQKMVRKILAEKYNATRNGLCGNDDCGQMSAWYILSAMGFYPVNPATGVYQLGSPCVQRAIIPVRNGKHFEIQARNQSEENIYVKSVSLNGKPLSRPFILHHEIMEGGNLIFEMDNKPNKNLY